MVLSQGTGQRKNRQQFYAHIVHDPRKKESSHAVSSGKASTSIYKIDIIHSSRVDFNNL